MNIFTTLPAAQEADKPLLFTLIKYICALKKKAGYEGLLALEAWIDTDYRYVTAAGGKRPFEGHPVLESFLAHLLRLLTDGCDSDFIADFARYSLATSTEDDSTTLACMIATEGIACLQRRDNSMECRLTSMLGLRMGDEFFSETRDEPFLLDFLEIPPLPDYDSWQEKYGEEWACLLAERTEDEIPFERIAHIDDMSMQSLCRCLDFTAHTTALAAALIPPNAKDVREAVFRNISEQAAMLLRYEMRSRCHDTPRQLFESQREIANEFRLFIEAGGLAANEHGTSTSCEKTDGKETL